jgi:hypothetical protein
MINSTDNPNIAKTMAGFDNAKTDGMRESDCQFAEARC